MKTFVTGMMLIGLAAIVGCSQTAAQQASAGPVGGDLIPIKRGTAYAEFLANADTGEVAIQTWDKDLMTRRPIESDPITVGSGDNSVKLRPHPMNTDPAGSSSCFYGKADWVRGGRIDHGWMHGGGAGENHTFDWSDCWQAGRTLDWGRYR